MNRLAAWASAGLQRAWWRPGVGLLAGALWPLSCLVVGLSRLNRKLWQSGWRTPQRLPVPVLVVGNLVVGGAGKTPTTIAIVQCLQAAGWRPGVISRGYGRQTDEVLAVTAATDPDRCGDEPLLILRRTGVPVTVGRDRAATGRSLLAAHPAVNILVSDDGLQHHRLCRDLQVIVFDRRGVGNGLVLPAGPLREPLAGQPPPGTLVLYNADRASTRWPGALATRGLAGAVDLADWHAGVAPSAQTLATLATRSRQEPMQAAAGLAEPARFFDMLAEAGLHVEPIALPDHASFDPLPWPATTRHVLVTEKDAVKIPATAGGPTRIWVVTLDFRLPSDFTATLLAALGPADKVANRNSS